MARFQRPLVFSLALLATASLAQASNTPNIEFGFGPQHDNGSNPGVAINSSNTILEVHQSQAGTNMWCKVGTAARTAINWNGGAWNYDSGKNPKVALNNNGVAVEVHQTSGLGSGMWYHVGSVSPGSVSWGPSISYDSGVTPSVGINNGGTVVEVHQSQSNSGMWYHVGTVSGSNISWGGSHNYDSGTTPSVAINSAGVVVEVHRSQSNSGLWYHVGTVSGGSINWGPSVNYDTGYGPSVAINDNGQVVETHTSGSGSLWQRTGVVSGSSINWIGGASYYDSGSSVAVAANSLLAVRSSANADFTMHASTSLFLDRSSWMENGLSVIGNMPLKQLAMPASHDAGMYENSVPQDLAETQDESINQQLYSGVRYFDLRPHWTGSDLEIFHGPIYAESLQTVLADVQAFMATNRKELVILKFSHYDNFDSNGVAYQTLTSWIQSYLGAWLITNKPAGVRLANMSINSLLNGQGRVLAVADGSQPLSQPASGIWVYRDWSSGDPQNGDLTVYDQYANVTDYPTMVNDQTAKFQSFNGTSQNNSSAPTDMFLLSWTLTPVTDVWAYAGTANEWIGNDINNIASPNAYGQRINMIYTDYVEYSRSTDLAAYMDGIKSTVNVTGPHRLLSLANGLAIDGGANSQGTYVQMYGSNGTNDQLWNIRLSGSGLSINSVQSGLALDGGPNSGGTHPWVWGGNGTADQQWLIQPYGAGYRIISVQSGLALDAAGAQGGNPQLNSPSGALTQQWLLQ